MLIAAVVAIYGLVYLEGAVQVIILAFTIVLAATTGLGMFFMRSRTSA